jgi:hypothetical protein
VNSPRALALSQLVSRMSSNQCRVLYPALKYSETRYRLPKQLILCVCGVLLSEHTDEDEVFAKCAAQMSDSSSDTLFIHPSANLQAPAPQAALLGTIKGLSDPIIMLGLCGSERPGLAEDLKLVMCWPGLA